MLYCVSAIANVQKWRGKEVVAVAQQSSQNLLFRSVVWLPCKSRGWQGLNGTSKMEVVGQQTESNLAVQLFKYNLLFSGCHCYFAFIGIPFSILTMKPNLQFFQFNTGTRVARKFEVRKDSQ